MQKTTSILALEPGCYARTTMARLEAIGRVVYAACESQREVDQLLSDNRFDIVLTKLGLYLGADQLNACPSIKWIVTPTTGTDHLDLHELGIREIGLISLRPYQGFLQTISSTAEHTWGLLLALKRMIVSAHQDVMSGNWSRLSFMGQELQNQTLGVVGCGRLGSMVAKYGNAFGMKVLVNDIDPRVYKTLDFEHECVDLDSLLRRSDVVTLHVHLAPQNIRMIARDQLKLMQKSASIINTSRGEIISESCLLEALESGTISAAAVDVLCGDSAWTTRSPQNNPLIEYARKNNNLIITPHLGGYTKSAIERSRDFVVEKLCDELSNTNREKQLL